jgi:gliding motility-associated-like protein
MKSLLFGLFVVVNFFFFSQIELSREVIGSAGQSVSNDHLQMSYTIGETFTATIQNDIIKTLGFQQPDVLPATELPFAIPGGLSPNDDNINDTWLLTGFENYPDARVKVFDRWGQEVFFATSTMAPWDGTFEGKDLPTADYYYIIDLGDGQKYNGVVTLKK